MKEQGGEILFSRREQELAGLPPAIAADASSVFDHVLRIEAIRTGAYIAANQASPPGSETEQRYGTVTYADDLGVLLAQLERIGGLVIPEGPDLSPAGSPQDFA